MKNNRRIFIIISTALLIAITAVIIVISVNNRSTINGDADPSRETASSLSADPDGANVILRLSLKGEYDYTMYVFNDKDLYYSDGESDEPKRIILSSFETEKLFEFVSMYRLNGFLDNPEYNPPDTDVDNVDEYPLLELQFDDKNYTHRFVNVSSHTELFAKYLAGRLPASVTGSDNLLAEFSWKMNG